MGDEDHYGWELPEGGGLRTITTAQGSPEWTSQIGLEPGQLEVRLRRRLVLPDYAEPVLWAGDDVLVARIDWEVDPADADFGTSMESTELPTSRIWIVAGGSFWLNHALVHPEHRKLALALSRALGRGRRIGFLLGTGEEPERSPSLLGFLTVSPINWIGGHLVVLALLYAAYRLPIFGRPQVIEEREVYRFGRHVQAMGQLLQATGNVSFAREQIRRYLGTSKSTKSAGPPTGQGKG